MATNMMWGTQTRKIDSIYQKLLYGQINEHVSREPCIRRHNMPVKSTRSREISWLTYLTYMTPDVNKQSTE